MTSFGFPLQFDKNVSYVVATFLTPKQYKFLDWIDQTKLNWANLSYWVDESIVKKNSTKIDWLNISCNENAPFLIYNIFENKHFFYQKIEEKLMQKRSPYYTDVEKCNDDIRVILWGHLSENSSDVAMKILLKHPDKINWRMLSKNSHPNAISILEQNQDKIDWWNLCYNSGAIQLLKEKTKDFTTNLDLVDRYNLCTNPAAIDIIKKNPHLIDWVGLSRNPKSLHMFHQIIEQSRWNRFYLNPSAIDYLKKNQHIICYEGLSFNEAIIELDVGNYNLCVSAYMKMVYHL
jgi:hypothetical protein